MARNTLVSGSVASVLSTFAVSCCSHWQSGSAVGGTNATSHWFWGDRAKREDRPSLRHTAVGYGIHHASSIFWAAFHEYAIRRARHPSSVVAAAAVTAATAYVVDYHVVPRRLTPGFDSRLSGGAMVAAYAAFAVGLGVVGWVRITRHR